MKHKYVRTNTKSTDRARRVRAYDSSLRDEQAAQTRQRIIEAFGEEVSGPGGDQITVQRVAARAGVSVPTLYRNFRSLDEVGMAFWEFIQPQLAALESIETADDLPRYVEGLFQRMSAQQPFLEAMLTTRTGRTLRERTVRSRNQAFERALAPLVKRLSEREARMVTGICKVVASGNVYLLLHKDWGLDGKEAGRASAWALRVLIDALRKDPNPFKPKKG